MKKVILAEKPSVARNIAEALKCKGKKDGYIEGNDYIITWAFGHLLQLYDARDYDKALAVWRMDNFPFIPSQFKYKIKSSMNNKDKEDLGAKKQIKIIKELINREDVEAIISACDYDREGQIIADIIFDFIKVKKPLYRILLNEWTPDEVLKGIQKLKENEAMMPLKDAGISRQWADWVIGINLTSVATLKYQRGKGGHPLNIGRVLLPTLKIIYDRDKEIENFDSKDYYKLVASFKTEKKEDYEGIYNLKGEEKFSSKEELEKLLASISTKKALVIDKKVELKKDYPPYLFNLSNLQGHVTSKAKGWTSDKVLKVAQSLYEKKYITYPRTASIALEESLVDRAEKVLKVLKAGLPYEDEVKFQVSKRVFNNAKVESHSAIIPTYVIPKNLTKDEELVYNAIKNRFIMQFMPIAEFEETVISTKLKDEDLPGLFISKGKVQKVEGWKKVEKIDSKDNILPYVAKDEEVDFKKAKITTHSTKPPKYHTEKTLLRVMETCGRSFNDEDSEEMMDAILSGFSIGTPATRAETIKKLKDAGYVCTNNKNLTCTELGKNLVETFPIKDLLDLEYTGKLEKTLSDIEKGKVKREEFLNLIFDFTRESVENIRKDKDIILNQVGEKPKDLEVIGKCPACGGDIIEGKKGFGCSNWRLGCKFVVWKEDKFLSSLGKKEIPKQVVMKLLKDGKIKAVGLKSKKGNTFDAYLSYVKNPDNEYYSWKMEFI